MRTDSTGDLFDVLDSTDPARTAVGHGVNLRGVMGSGIAPLFARRFDGLLPAYRTACREGHLELGGVFPWMADDGRWVMNCASQDRTGADARLDALASSVIAALAACDERRLSELLLPRIGAGIGGLSWPEVSSVLDRASAASPVTLHVVSLPGA